MQIDPFQPPLASGCVFSLSQRSGRAPQFCGCWPAGWYISINWWLSNFPSLSHPPPCLSHHPTKTHMYTCRQLLCSCKWENTLGMHEWLEMATSYVQNISKYCFCLDCSEKVEKLSLWREAEHKARQESWAEIVSGGSMTHGHDHDARL